MAEDSWFGPFYLKVLELEPLLMLDAVNLGCARKVVARKAANGKDHLPFLVVDKSMTCPCFIHVCDGSYGVLLEVFSDGDNEGFAGRLHLLDVGPDCSSAYQEHAVTECDCCIEEGKFRCELDLLLRFGTDPIDFGLPTVHPSPLLDQLEHKQLHVAGFFDRQGI